jgi:glycosyltransferase involved in cell wall biosynthesis
MFFGVPLLVQNSSAIPETVGGSALLVDKANPSATLEALHSVLSCAKTNQELRARSKERADQYRWPSLEAQVGVCLKTLEQDFR